MQLIKPTVHSNGDSAKNLTEGFCKARSAVMDAMEAIQQTSPNGRNFYPQGDTALKQAIEEHTIRLKRLNDVAEELQLLAEHCSDFIK